MGRSKPLLPLGNRPAIIHCLENLRQAGIDDIVVVVGKEGDEIRGTIGSFPATVVRNGIPGADMSQSVRIGLAKIDPASTGILVCLADQPLVTAKTFISLRHSHAERPDRIIVPLFNGRRGHPPLLPEKIAAEITTVPTLRDLIERHSGEVWYVEVHDEGVVLDMDTEEDYERMAERYSAAAKKNVPEKQ
ncbi:MAG TPA: nucleotidyltransferase family protein [Thermodesulfovibrionales bacterium]|nr:nucleotidyltransferase family protein [Thermodesulfovibrionales bacterium]